VTNYITGQCEKEKAENMTVWAALLEVNSNFFSKHQIGHKRKMLVSVLLRAVNMKLIKDVHYYLYLLGTARYHELLLRGAV
jgi:hypothetical protein